MSAVTGVEVASKSWRASKLGEKKETGDGKVAGLKKSDGKRVQGDWGGEKGSLPRRGDPLERLEELREAS